MRAYLKWEIIHMTSKLVWTYMPLAAILFLVAMLPVNDEIRGVMGYTSLTIGVIVFYQVVYFPAHYIKQVFCSKTAFLYGITPLAQGGKVLVTQMLLCAHCLLSGIMIIIGEGVMKRYATARMSFIEVGPTNAQFLMVVMIILGWLIPQLYYCTTLVGKGLSDSLKYGRLIGNLIFVVLVLGLVRFMVYDMALALVCSAALGLVVTLSNLFFSKKNDVVLFGL